MSNYYDRPEISNSDIKLINKSLDHYLRKNEFKDKKAFADGRAFHYYMEDINIFNEKCVVKPKGMEFRTDKNKEWRDHHLNNGTIIVDEDYYLSLSYMKKNIINHRLYPLISEGKVEVEKKIYFEYDNILCRAKPDLINHSNGLIIDYKTTANMRKMKNDIQYEYASQAFFYQFAIYCLTGKIYDFIFVFCEKSMPYGVQYAKASAETLDSGKQFIDKGIAKIKEFREYPNMYTGYNDELIIV